MEFLFKNQTNIFNSNYFRVAIYLLSAVLYAYFAGLSLPDDGLRHIAFAAHQDIMHSWGEVFPHSLFFKEYDPWFVWHKIIAVYLLVFPYESVHLAINSTVLFMFMMLLDRLLLRFSNFKQKPLLIFIILSITLLGSFKYINVRPDLLSGFFLMAGLLLNRHILILFVVTILYSTSYYLFFLYTGSLGLLYLVLKNYKAFTALFVGSLFGLAFHLYFGEEYYVKTIFYLLTDQNLREGLDVGEGMPLFSFLGLFNYYILVLISWSISFFIIFKKYSYFKNQPIITLLLIMSPLWLAQARYFILLQPLLFLYLFIESKTIVDRLFPRHIRYYIYRFTHTLSSAQYKMIFILPALLYSSFMFAYMMKDFDNSELLAHKSYYKNKLFDNKRVLLNSFTQEIYFGLYQNPTISFIPSCSIGWFEENKEMKDIYIRMMKDRGITEEELNRLLVFTKSDYYIHFLKNREQVLSFKKLQKFGIVPITILNNKIIFQKKEIHE